MATFTTSDTKRSRRSVRIITLPAGVIKYTQPSNQGLDNTALKQDLEFINKRRNGLGSFSEPILNLDGDVTMIKYWDNSSKTILYFTETFTYSNGSITNITLKDEITNKTLNTHIDHGFDPPRLTKTII